jgi:hypothetical protein
VSAVAHARVKRIGVGHRSFLRRELSPIRSAPANARPEAGNRLPGVDWDECSGAALADREICIGLRTRVGAVDAEVAANWNLRNCVLGCGSSVRRHRDIRGRNGVSVGSYAQAANNAKQKTEDRRIEKERPEDFIASSFR